MRVRDGADAARRDRGAEREERDGVGAFAVVPEEEDDGVVGVGVAPEAGT